MHLALQIVGGIALMLTATVLVGTGFMASDDGQRRAKLRRRHG